VSKNLKHTRKLLGVMLLCLLNTAMYSQNYTESDSAGMPMGDKSAKNYVPVSSFYFNNYFPEIETYSDVDTSVHGIQRTEILSASQHLYAHTGLIGQACFPMNFTFQRQHGFHYKTMPYAEYHRNFKNWKWYYTPESYTRIDYEWASGKENMFDVVHAQTIKNLVFEVDFRTIIAEGIYVRQAVRDVNVGTRFSYFTHRKRYGFTFAYIYNLFRLNENGGIYSDSLFENKKLPPRSIAVTFSNASNNYQDHDLFFRHHVSLSKMKLDSNQKRINLGYIVHDIEFTKLKSLYRDDNLNPHNYGEINYDSLVTFDSVNSYQLRNSLMWTNYLHSDSLLMSKSYFLHLVFGIAHTYLKVGDSSTNFYNFQLTPFANVHLRLFRYLDLKTNLLYSLNAYNSNDITSESSIIWHFKNKNDKKHFLAFNAILYRFQPDYFYTYYLANTFSWENYSLKKQLFLQLGLQWQYERYCVALNYYNLQKWMIIGSDLQPNQLETPANIIQMATYVPFRYKGFGFDVNAYVQHCDNKYINMPWLATREAVFYGFPMFKKALFMQLGFEMLYNTPYFANAYNPIMQQFYFQDKKKIGNYFYFDFFTNVKVQRFYFHFVLGNFLESVFSRTYYLLPHYPAKGLHFKIGASWRFHD